MSQSNVQMSPDQLLAFAQLGLGIKKLVKALLEVNKRAAVGGKAFYRAQAIVQKRMNGLREAGTEFGVSFASDTDGAQVAKVQRSVDQAITRITADMRAHGPKLRVYWWIGQLAEAVPDDAWPEKGLLVKRLAKMVNDLDDDDDLDEEEMQSLLDQFNSEQQARQEET